MAGKKSTPVKPAPPSASSPKHRPKLTPKASAAGAKVSSAAKPRKNSVEKSALAKKKRDKPEPEAGAKRKKQQQQQASSEAGKPKKKKGKKRDESESTPHKEAAASTKKLQPPPGRKPENLAPTPAKKKQQQPGKSATPAKKQQRPGKSATPAKKKQQQSSGKAQKPAAAATTPMKTKQQQKEQDAKREKQQVPGGTRKSTPTKRKRGDAEPPKEARSPTKGALSGKGEAGAPTPAKKKHKDKKADVTDLGTCSFPMARVRQLMRAEDDTIRASSEAVFLINKASELFLKKFADDAYWNALKDRKKSIIYDNLSTTVCSRKGFKFLSDFIPQRLRAEDALKAAAAASAP